MRHLIFTFTLAVTFLLLVIGLAHAAIAPENAIDQGKGLYASIRGGEILLAFGFGGMLLGSIARWSGKKKFEFLDGKVGGYVIAVFIGLGILGGGIVTSGTITMELAVTAFLGMTSAMGMHGPVKAMVKKAKGDNAVK